MRRVGLSIQLGISLLLGPMLIAEECRPSFWGEETLAQLEREGEMRYTFRGAEALRLFPDLPIKGQYTKEIENLKPTLGVEYLLSTELTSRGSEDGTTQLCIYNALRSISTLKGVEYYSASRERMRVFFQDAYVIDHPETRERQEDPLVTEIPDASTIFAFLRDSSLGNYIAVADYIHNDGYFGMSITNWSVLRKFWIPMVQPNRLKSLILLFPCEGKLYFYGLSYVRTFALFSRQAREASFYNRLVALLNWFQNEYGILCEN
jgi:hypothetical protein